MSGHCQICTSRALFFVQPYKSLKTMHEISTLKHIQIGGDSNESL